MTSAAIELITKHAQFQALYEIFALAPEDATYADAVNMLQAQDQEGTCADLPEGWECHGGASGNLTYDEMSPALLAKELESWFNVYRSFGSELIDEFSDNLMLSNTILLKHAGYQRRAGVHEEAFRGIVEKHVNVPAPQAPVMPTDYLHHPQPPAGLSV